MPQTDNTYNSQPVFDFNGLVSRPQAVRRSLFNMFGRIHVQPGTCVLITGNGGFESILSPGNHTHMSLPAGPLVIQIVNMTVQQRILQGVSALSRDKWQVTLSGVLSFQVADPFKVANTAWILETLDTALRAALLALMEEFDHDALTGKVEVSLPFTGAPDSSYPDPDEVGTETTSGIGTLCRKVVERLKTDPSLAALEIINFHVTSRAGDERRIKITQESSVEQTRILEESRVKRLEHQIQLLSLGAELEQRQEEHKIRQLELEEERTTAQNTELLKLMQSETESKMAYLMRGEREWQAQQKRQEDEWRVAREFDMLQLKSRHEEAIEAIRGTTIVSAEAAHNGQLNANLNVSPRRRAEIVASDQATSGSNNPNGDIISQGLQALKDLPSAGNSYAFFLPNRLQSGTPPAPNLDGNTASGQSATGVENSKPASVDKEKENAGDS